MKLHLRMFENVVIGEGAGFKIAILTFDIARPPVAVGAVCLPKRALYEAINYSLQRTTCGVPIAQHEAVSLLLADIGVFKCYAADVCNCVVSDTVQVLEELDSILSIL